MDGAGGASALDRHAAAFWFAGAELAAGRAGSRHAARLLDRRSQAVVDAGALDAFTAFKAGLGFRMFVATTEAIAAARLPSISESSSEYLKRAHRENTADPQTSDTSS